MTFPELKPGTWRTDRPYIVTLSDGDRLPAYPIHGAIEDSVLCFGHACVTPMWLVNDSMIESALIHRYDNAKIIEAADVVAWEEIAPAPKREVAHG